MYTALRMNWLLDPKIEVEEWQIADYRNMPLRDIFRRLDDLDIDLDPEDYIAVAEECDTPEELIDIQTEGFDPLEREKAGLLLFELWRRLLPEKLCLSIFCDELDHQIFLYDQGQLQSEESMEDILANLEMLLDDYTDQGNDPLQIFNMVATGCANDVENFLYDYIATQLNSGNPAYASELIDAFEDYLPTQKWLDFFRARITAGMDPLGANMMVAELAEDAEKEHDSEFNFALLAFLVQQGDQELFVRIVKATLPLLELEEDFQELLHICEDHYRLLDQEENERAIKDLLAKRSDRDLDAEINRNDSDFKTLTSITG